MSRPLRYITVKITKVETGETVDYQCPDWSEHWRDDDDHGNSGGYYFEQMWETGNYSCDCNRELFWHRTKFPYDEYEPVVKCSDGRFTVEIIFPEEKS